MDTLAPNTLDGSLQALVDARLDTIDRMLMGMLPRADRLAIVREVENQIDELIANQSPAPQTREDILEILARLDPPEAFLPEEGSHLSAQNGLSDKSASKPGMLKANGWEWGKVGGILSIVGLVLFVPAAAIPYGVANMTSSYLIFGLMVSLMVIYGLTAASGSLTLSILGRKQGTLPLIGMILSPLILFFTLIATIFYIMLIMID